MSTTAGPTSAAAAPTSAVMSAAAATLGKLWRHQYERRMSTICLVHSFVYPISTLPEHLHST